MESLKNRPQNNWPQSYAVMCITNKSKKSKAIPVTGREDP
jgi:hypothetical protein